MTGSGENLRKYLFEMDGTSRGHGGTEVFAKRRAPCRISAPSELSSPDSMPPTYQSKGISSGSSQAKFRATVKPSDPFNPVACPGEASKNLVRPKALATLVFHWSG